MKPLTILAVILLPFVAACAQSSLSGEARTGGKTNPIEPSASGTAKSGPEVPVSPDSLIRFRDVAQEVGLTTVPQTTTKRRYIVDTMNGGGVALFDCNNDGKLDIAVVRDSSIERNLAGGDLMVTLYQQDGTGNKIHFSDVTASSGMLTKGWATGLAVADFDNDGLPDL